MDLAKANYLEKENFGSVYKRTLQDVMQVAIKVFRFHLEEALKSFDVECEIIRYTRYRNLVKIISGC